MIAAGKIFVFAREWVSAGLIHCLYQSFLLFIMKPLVHFAPTPLKNLPPRVLSYAWPGGLRIALPQKYIEKQN